MADPLRGSFLPGIRKPQGPGSPKSRAHAQTRQKQNILLVRDYERNFQKSCTLYFYLHPLENLVISMIYLKILDFWVMVLSCPRMEVEKVIIY